MTIQQRIQDYINAEEIVKLAESALTGAKASLAEAEQLVLDAFADDPKQGAISYDGRKWEPENVTKLSPAEDCGQLVVDYIAANGGADLVKPNMHWQRRNAFLNERFIDDDGVVTLPEELQGLVTVFDQPRLAKRKA